MSKLTVDKYDYDKLNEKCEQLTNLLSEIFNSLKQEGWSMNGAWAEKTATALKETFEPEESYDCPIHGKQIGADCPRC